MKVYIIKNNEGEYIERIYKSEDNELVLEMTNIKSDAIIFTEKEVKEKLAEINRKFINTSMSFELEETGGVDYMEYGKKECIVCKKEFEIRKENKYIVSMNPGLFSIAGLKEAFNCPYCGCQNIVNSYNQEYDNDKKKKLK